MGGRFGKYGDLKRRKALQRGRKEAARLAKGWSMNRQNRRRIIPSAHTSLHPLAQKTHKTAVVVIPPDDLWAPIQALRKQYDRHFRRWMPHITLLYPFRPLTEFKRLAPILSQACRLKEPFEVRLRRFDFFAHSRHSATFYLVPEPVSAIKALHQALLEKVPDCSDLALFAGEFTPHLSLGQTRSRDIEAFCSRWQATWRPLSFTLKQVHVIWRKNPPDDVFRIGPVLSLGTQKTNC
jgi:2'-5' RNA ligase